VSILIKKNINLSKINKYTYLKKKKKKKGKKGREKGWLGHPQPMGVAGGGQGLAGPPFFFYLFIFF
jgi:hypothetical protein